LSDYCDEQWEDYLRRKALKREPPKTPKDEYKKSRAARWRSISELRKSIAAGEGLK
jgi:hypothetical protein